MRWIGEAGSAAAGHERVSGIDAGPASGYAVGQGGTTGATGRARAKPEDDRLRAACLLLCLVALLVPSARACGPDSNCPVAQGSYRMRAPPGWDGRTALPVLVFFHGFKGSAAATMRDRGLGAVLAGRGILLVAPDGLDGSWSFRGAPAHARDDLAYTRAVLDDVATRLPIDRTRLWASGFSLGGSIVWSIACTAPELFAGYAPIAGALWDPLPTRCAGPVDLVHVHGLSDPTMPLEGRPIAGQWHQGDVFASFALLRTTDGCARPPSRFASEGPLLCRIWDGCASGKALRMCLHPFGHDLRPAWLESALDWLETRHAD